ncbi:ABC transporter permease [Roseiconus lacunae]|uniref:ABC transporter permease n=1 Tax=Roseiconus lacunae TaxID=2605694 RepID=UPI003085466E|nr:ABC transporter permease [Stieleria sp. HD01]
MLLPWEYGVRNLARRPIRTTLTLVAMATVVMLVFVVVGFIRGLEQSLAVSGEEDVVLVYSVNSEENIENSSITAQTPSLLNASIGSVWRRYGIAHVSPELYMGTRVTTATVDETSETSRSSSNALGLIRGVTPNAPLIRRSVRLIEGDWPTAGSVIVGNLVAAKLGVEENELKIGNTLQFEGRNWKIAGRFVAGGSAYESEIWCDLTDFQTATQRQDLSLVAMRLDPNASPAKVALFCKERTDLELRAIGEKQYYATLQQHYRPVRQLAWLVVILVTGAGFFAGLNMMYGAVSGRVRELATLQAIGFKRRAILFSLIQEGVLLATTASLISGLVALTAFNGVAVRFTMGAFPLAIDGIAVLIGSAVGILLGAFGALPPALKALRESVAIGLKAV